MRIQSREFRLSMFTAIFALLLLRPSVTAFLYAQPPVRESFDFVTILAYWPLRQLYKKIDERFIKTQTAFYWGIGLAFLLAIIAFYTSVLLITLVILFLGRL